VSSSDRFIEEVREEVQRDRLWGYVRRYGWTALVAVLGLVAFIAWSEYRKAQAIQAARALGDRIIEAADAEDPAARAEALGSLASESGAAKVIVQMRQAAALVEAEDTEGAVAIYQSVAEGSGDPIYADLAALKALILQGDTLGIDARVAVINILAAPGAPFRPLALEQKALVLIDTGDPDGAITILTDLIEDSEATDAMRIRAGQILAALGGTAPSAPQLFSEQ